VLVCYVINFFTVIRSVNHKDISGKRIKTMMINNINIIEGVTLSKILGIRKIIISNF